MRARTGAAMASVAAGIAVVPLVVLLASGGSGTSPTPDGPAEGAERPTSAVPKTHPRGALADCSTRSEANFPGAFADPDNLVVGPLVLVGGAYTPATTIREFGGNKFPALVRAEHTVTVQLPPAARGFAKLGWGRRAGASPHAARTTVTFVACRPGQPSGSDVRKRSVIGRRVDEVLAEERRARRRGKGAVTFWSGGASTDRIACVPLDVYVDDEPAPRGAALGLGRRCPR